MTDHAHHGRVGDIAEFVMRLHATPPASLVGVIDPDPYPHHDAIVEARATADRVRDDIDARQRRVLDRFLHTEPPDDVGTQCFVHNDLGAEHLIVDADTSELMGVIDWADAAIADPARDLARVRRDLPAAVYERVRAIYPADVALDERVEFLARCGLLEDLAFGIEHHRPEYRTNALQRFDDLFRR